MVSLTAIALGVSVITTGIISLQDALKQMGNARGFIGFMLSQNMQTNTEHAIDCFKGAI